MQDAKRLCEANKQTKKLAKSRNHWKERVHENRLKIQSLLKKTDDLEESRDMWKQRYKDLEQQMKIQKKELEEKKN
jgi:hypothetical protein